MSGRRGRYALVAVAAILGQTANGIVLNGLSMVADAMIADLWPGGTRSRASVLTYFTVLLLLSIAAMPFAGRLVTRIGSKLLLIIGGSIGTLGFVGMSMVNGMPGLYVTGAVIGLGIGFSVNFVPVVLINAWFDKWKAPVMGLVLGGSGVGGILSSLVLPLTTPPVSDGGLGWRASLLLAAAGFFACSVLPAIFMVVNRPSDAGLPIYGQQEIRLPDASGLDAEPLPGLTLRQALRTPWFWVLYAMAALLGVYYAMGQITTPFFTNQQTDPTSGMTPGLVAALMSVQMVGLIAAKPTLGTMIDKLGIIRAMIISMSIHAVVGVLLGWIRFPAPWWVFVVIFLIGAGFAVGTLTTPLACGMAFGQRDFAAIWGVLGTAYALGLAVGTPAWSAAGTINADPGQPWQLYRFALQWCWVIAVAVVIGFRASIKGGRAAQARLQPDAGKMEA